MCLEDLRLGRGRFQKDTVQTGVTLANALKADESRVAIIVSFIGLYTFDGTGAIIEIDQLRLFSGQTVNGSPFLSVLGKSFTTVLRIEDLGSVVTGPISVSMLSQTGSGAVFLTPICTAVNAPPLDTYKP